MQVFDKAIFMLVLLTGKILIKKQAENYLKIKKNIANNEQLPLVMRIYSLKSFFR
jgi:hypothetical protein